MTAELTMAERTRSVEKDMAITAKMRNLLVWIDEQQKINELPYANDLAFRLGDLARAAERILATTEEST